MLLRVLTKEAMIPLCEAIKFITVNPARVMGLSDKGILDEGKDADIVVFDADINVKAVFVGGAKVK